MIRARIECPCCGTKFTPDSDNDVTCGECELWRREDRPLEQPVDFGPSAQNPQRSLDNYRRASGIPRRR